MTTDKAEHIVDLVAAVVGRQFAVTETGGIRHGGRGGDCPLCAAMNAVNTEEQYALMPGYQRALDEGGLAAMSAHRYINGRLDREWQRFILAADNCEDEPEFDPKLREYMIEQLCTT